MEIGLKRKLGVAAFLLGLCLAFAPLTMLTGCGGTVLNLGGNVTQFLADNEAEVNADSAEVDQTDGGTALGNPLEAAKPETQEPSEPPPTLDE